MGTEIKGISITQILERIQNAQTLDLFEERNAVEDLKKFYEYLISKKGSHFKEYTLLPNIKNVLMKETELCTHSDIPPVFIDIADVIIPEISKRFIKSGFEFEEFKLISHSYSKEEYSGNINAALSKFKIDISNVLPEKIYRQLITYCTIFNSPDDNSKRKSLVALICKYYEYSPDFFVVSHTMQDIDWRTPEKRLLENFICDLHRLLSNNPKSVTLENYYDLLDIISEWSEVSGIIQALPLFPNQEEKICKMVELEIDNSIPEEMKDLYDKIVALGNPSIRSRLVYNKDKDFSRFLFGKLKDPEIVGREIEEELGKHSLTDINEHPSKEPILKIISYIQSEVHQSEKLWTKCFPTIDGKKQDIMFAACSNPETKDLLTDILSDPEKANRCKKMLDLHPNQAEKVGKFIEALEKKEGDSNSLEEEDWAFDILKSMNPERADRLEKMWKQGTDKISDSPISEEDEEFDQTTPDFPVEEIIDLDAILENMRYIFEHADEVRYEKLRRSIRTSRKGDREHIGYRYCGHCQMCDDKNPYWKTTEIFLEPEKEINQMNLSLCPNCAAKYRHLRGNPDIMSKFKSDIVNADISNGELKLPIDNADFLRFTAQHLAEIRSVLLFMHNNKGVGELYEAL